jgi:hypothetical protein
MRLIFEFLPSDFKDRGQGYVQAIGGGVGFLAGQTVCAYLIGFLPSVKYSYFLFYLSSWVSLLAVVITFRIRRSVENMETQGV